MKNGRIYLVKTENEKGTFTGLSNVPTEGCVYSVDTDHADEFIMKFMDFIGNDSFEMSGIRFFDFLPESVLSFVRDYVWNNWNEQGIVNKI